MGFQMLMVIGLETQMGFQTGFPKGFLMDFQMEIHLSSQKGFQMLMVIN